MRAKPPCKVDGVDCSRRYVGCKAGCDEWHRWLAIHAEEKDKIRREKDKCIDADSFLVNQNKRLVQDRQRRYTERHRKSHWKG